jgi:hypothetical protein
VTLALFLVWSVGVFGSLTLFRKFGGGVLDRFDYSLALLWPVVVLLMIASLLVPARFKSTNGDDESGDTQ